MHCTYLYFEKNMYTQYTGYNTKNNFLDRILLSKIVGNMAAKKSPKVAR